MVFGVFVELFVTKNDGFGGMKRRSMMGLGSWFHP